MKDRDCDHSQNKHAAIFLRPLEKIVNADGSEGIISETVVAGNDPEVMNAALENFFEHTGAEVLTGQELRAFHAFSSSRWNSTWNPSGPKSNWRQPPQDPSLN